MIGIAKISCLTLIVLAIAAIIPAHAENISGTFSLHSTFQEQTGSQNWNHNGGQSISWTLNASYYGDGGWYISPAMQANASAFSDWQFASKYWNVGAYTQSKSGTIKFYNSSSRSAASKVGEGTIAYTYLGTGNYGAVSVHMTSRLPSGSQFYPLSNTVWTTISDSDLAGIGSDYTGGGGYTGQNFIVPKYNNEGPVTGDSFGYNRWLIEGDWAVEYNATITDLYSTYTITPKTGVFRTWSVSGDGSTANPVTAWKGSAYSNTTFNRELVYVQDPFTLSTTNTFWVGIPATYNLTMIPGEISAGGTSTASIQSSSFAFADVNGVSFECTPFSCQYNSEEQPAFYLKSGTWKQFNTATGDFDIAYGASAPTTLPLTFNGAGNETVRVVLSKAITNEPPGVLLANVNVGSSNNTVLTLTVNVKSTADKSPLIQGATISLKNTGSGAWQNYTTSSGQHQFSIFPDQYYSWTANHSAYMPAWNAYTGKFSADATVDFYLTPYRNTTVAGNASTGILVLDRDTHAGIKDATVFLNEDGQSKTTPESGFISFETRSGVTYTATASANGYQSKVVSFTPTAGSGGGISILLERDYSSNIETPVPTITGPGGAVITVTPTLPLACSQYGIDSPECATARDMQTANDLRDYAPQLIGFFVVLFLVGGLKMMGK